MQRSFSLKLILISYFVFLFLSSCSLSQSYMLSATPTTPVTDFPVSTEISLIANCELSIMGFGAMNLLISDPLGRYLGIPLESTEIVNEIPGADYEFDPTWGEDEARGDGVSQSESLSVAHIPDPVEGLYVLQIHWQSISQRGGLSVIARCSDESETTRMIILEENQKIPITYQYAFFPENENIISELEIEK